MGCLFEIFGEMFLEVFWHWFTSVYLNLAHILVPGISQKTEARIEKTVAVIFALLLLTLLFGLVFCFAGSAESNPTLHTVGLYMTFISLSVILFHMLLSLVVWLFKVLKD